MANIDGTFTNMSYRSFTDCISYRNLDTFTPGMRRRIINGTFTKNYRNKFNGRYKKGLWAGLIKEL